MGYKIKLDTNGSNPVVLKDLCDNKLIDYVAMDIKNSKEKYNETTGFCNINLSDIEKSVDYLKDGKIPYEFRTTVVKELHKAEDFEKIAKWINGCSNYFLQNYRDSETVLVSGFHSCTNEEMEHYMNIVKPHVKNIKIRGV